MAIQRSAQRETVAEMIARAEREANDPVLVAARLQELRDRVAAYEREFGMPSTEIHAAIDRGDLIETNEVCSWILAYHRLVRVDQTNDA